MVSPQPLAARSGIISLLTDFGLSDHYAGVLKAAVLAREPSARLVDITHLVPPQAVEIGAYLLETAWGVFPPGSVHLAVVDPGVGTGRRRLAIASGEHFFVGPDNGLLSSALPDSVRGRRTAGAAYESRPVSLPPEVVAVSIENEAIFRQPVSATFEGRDVFAPAAAFLAAGGPIDDLGSRIDSVSALPAFRAPMRTGRVDGLVLHVDHFGNLMTDVHRDDLSLTPTFVVAGIRVGFARTYGEASKPVAVITSSGFVEIAMPNGNAALVLGAGLGDRVQVEAGA